MKKLFKSLTLLLCLAMLLSMFPTAFADANSSKYSQGEPDFSKYDLDKYLRAISSGETFEYRTSGWTGKKVDADHKAKADVTARWAVFYDKNTDKDDRDLSNVYVPWGVKLRYVSFNNTQMKAAQKIERQAGAGYEWRGIEVKLKYTSYPYGYATQTCFEDYYDIPGNDEALTWLDSVEKKSYYLSTFQSEISATGETYYGLCRTKNSNGYLIYDVFYYVPKGYDGCVFGLLDGRQNPNGWGVGAHVYNYVSKYCLLFRLK